MTTGASRGAAGRRAGVSSRRTDSDLHRTGVIPNRGLGAGIPSAAGADPEGAVERPAVAASRGQRDTELRRTFAAGEQAFGIAPVSSAARERVAARSAASVLSELEDARGFAVDSIHQRGIPSVAGRAGAGGATGPTEHLSLRRGGESRRPCESGSAGRR